MGLGGKTTVPPPFLYMGYRRARECAKHSLAFSIMDISGVRVGAFLFSPVIVVERTIWYGTATAFRRWTRGPGRNLLSYVGVAVRILEHGALIVALVLYCHSF